MNHEAHVENVTDIDLVIIGSGPAGMAAAIYAKRAGMKTVLLEKTGISGGQVLNTYEVDNYPGLPMISGFDLSENFRSHAERIGVTSREGEVEKIVDQGKTKLVVTKEGTLVTKAVIIATGADHARLGVPGEDELAGMGVSYCATCDGAFFKDRDVVVVGGGNTACEDALYLARFCENVYLLNRSKRFRAAATILEKVRENPKITVYEDIVAEKFEGNGVLERVIVKNTATGERGFINAAGAIIAIGVTPESALAKSCGVETCPLGFIKTDIYLKTNLDGVFAAGDARVTPLRQVITAAADGAVAATSAINYVNELKI